MPLPAAHVHTECSWPRLDPAGTRRQPRLRWVVSGPRAGMVAVQRQWACAVVALDRVHGGSQVAASVLSEGGVPMEELGACVPAHAGGRQRQPPCAGAAPHGSGDVKLEGAARPIQTIGKVMQNKVRTVLGEVLKTNPMPQSSLPLRRLSYPKGSHSRRKPVQDQHHVPWEKRGAQPVSLDHTSTLLEAQLPTPTRPVPWFTPRAQSLRFTTGRAART